MTFDALVTIVRETHFAIWIDEDRGILQIMKRDIVERESRAGGKTLITISETLAAELDLCG